MIKVSLPLNTHLPLPGGTWELLGTKWARTEEPRWWYENGRIIAHFTREEAVISMGMLEREPIDHSGQGGAGHGRVLRG
jgi:hypothetical protein